MGNKVYYSQNSFVTGEVTPDMLGRIDIDRRANSCEVLENFLPLVHGGITTRPGTEFVSRTKEGAILIPFVFSVGQTYQIEAYHQTFRFLSNGFRITESPKNITNVQDNGSGGIRVTVSGHGLTTGDGVAIEGVGGTIEANDEWDVTVINANTFDLDGSTFTNAYTTGGELKRFVTLATPYTLAQLPALRWAQDANQLYLAHPSHAPRVLNRTGPNTFTLSNFVFDGGPFQPVNRDINHTMSASGTSGTVTITSSKNFFTAAMVGAFIRIAGTTGTPAEQGFAQITAFTNATTVTAEVKHVLSSGSATDQWAIGAWSGEAGWPSTVGIVQQRLIFAQTPTQPDRAWASAIRIFNDYSVSTNDDRAFEIAVPETNTFRWLSGQKSLLIGTSGSEFHVRGGNAGLTPSSAVIEKQSSYGSSDIIPVLVANNTVYVDRSKRKVRSIEFSFNDDAFVSPDLSLLSRHLFDVGVITRMAYQQEPNSVLWCVLDDGTLVSLTWMKDQEVVSWARHSIQNAWIHDIVGTPNDGMFADEITLIVERTIAGSPAFYIERLSYGTFVDANLQGLINGRTIRGLRHLEGQEVWIIGDGAPYAPQTVVDGAVTIAHNEPDLGWAIVGLLAQATCVTAEPALPTQEFTGYTHKKRWSRGIIRTIQTLGLFINGKKTPIRSTEDEMDEAVPIPALLDLPFSQLGWDDRARITLEQRLPLPTTILGVYGQLEIGDS